jgi:hypothetical protein
MANRQIITIMKVKLLRIGFAINNNDHDPGMAGKPCYKIHSLFFFDYVVRYDVSIIRIVKKGKYQNDSSHGYSSFCLQLLLQ